MYSIYLQRKKCVLHGEKANLSTSCYGSNPSLFGVFSRPQLKIVTDACLINETLSEDDMYVFEYTTSFECAALCQGWFECQSYSYISTAFTCELYKSAEYKEVCLIEAKREIAIYYSDYYFIRLNEEFCVDSNTMIAFQINTPLELCKLLWYVHKCYFCENIIFGKAKNTVFLICIHSAAVII